MISELELDLIAQRYANSISAYDDPEPLIAIENSDYRNNPYDYDLGYQELDTGDWISYKWINLRELGLV